MAISSRDFVEKSLQFWDGNKFYKYTTSVYNSELPGPNGEKPLVSIPNKSTVRGFTNLNAIMVYRN